MSPGPYSRPFAYLLFGVALALLAAVLVWILVGL
jgi:hypothetical protein